MFDDGPRRTHKQWLIGILQQRDASVRWERLPTSDLRKVLALIGGDLKIMKKLTSERWISFTEWSKENEGK